VNIASYLTAPLGGPGSLSWVFLVVQLTIAVVGGYLAFIRPDAKALRKQALQRLGYAMIGLGALGTIIAGLRLAVVPPFNARYWSLIVIAFEVALAIYAYYYRHTTYPAQVAQLAASAKSGRRVASRPPPSPVPTVSNGAPAVEPAVRVENSGRRGSRRERKRRKR
jgi:hypothetical protein